MTKLFTVVVTRPAHQSNELCEAIQRLGATPISFPTLNILPPADITKFRAAIHTLNTFDILIFTSANTLLFLTAFPSLHHCIVLTIGPGTANALEKLGVNVNTVAPAPHTSEALLGLPVLQHVKGLRIGIVTGQGGRKVLANTLTQRGALVQTIISYERHLPTINPAGLEKILDADMIVISSAESFHNFMTLTRPCGAFLLRKELLVSSQKLMKLGKEAGFSDILLAENASTAALLAALQERINGKSRQSSNRNET